jgi:hypothetical protein
LLLIISAILALGLPRGASAGVIPGGADARLLKESGLAVRKAGLVVEAVVGAVLRPEPILEITVTSVLKGEVGEGPLSVRMEKAPLGRWPKKGEARIFCLVSVAKAEPAVPARKHLVLTAEGAENAEKVVKVNVENAEGATAAVKSDGVVSAPDAVPARSTAYELATHRGSIIPVTHEMREAVLAWLKGQAPEPAQSTAALALRMVEPAEPVTPLPDSPESQDASPGVNPYLRAAAASDAVLIGTLMGVGPEGGSGSDVVGSFAVTGALFGYGGFRSPISVRFPAGRAGATQPPPGRCVLFVTGSRYGGGFVVVERVRLINAKGEAETKRLVKEAIGLRSARLTTVQATLAEWQGAWNARDVARCMLCYSRKSRLRRRYASGGSARRNLVRQIKESPGAAAISIEAIRIVLAPTSDGAREAAEVDVVLEFTPKPGATASQRATMQFVREKGEWLILREGF